MQNATCNVWAKEPRTPPPTCPISFTDQSSPPLGRVLIAHIAYKFPSPEIENFEAKEQEGGRGREGGVEERVDAVIMPT